MRGEPDGEGLFRRLRSALRDHSLIAAQAASIIAERDFFQLTPAVAAALEERFDSKKHPDPGCNAKLSMAKALYELGYREESLYLRGVRTVQFEAVWGGKEDVAGPLRATCALGLVASGSSELMVTLADLLADPVADARLGAVRALAATAQPAAIPLLRYKAQIGDENQQVVYECMLALLKTAPSTSLELVSALLQGDNAMTAEMAALALGESRHPQAAGILIDWHAQLVEPERRHPILTALALLRTDDAQEYLLELVATAPKGVALDAAQALSVYRSDLTLWQRVERRILRRNDLTLNQVFSARIR